MLKNVVVLVLGVVSFAFALGSCSLHREAIARQFKGADYSKQALDKGLVLPKPEGDGRLQTLNKKGAMSPVVDPISQKFIAASKGQRQVLEIGSAYGLVAMESLRLGNRDFTANDLDERHLKILAREVAEKEPLLLPYLTLAPGDFPNAVGFDANQFDGILIARVLHFFTPEKTRKAIRETLRILKPGGHVYVLALTPYVKRFKSFIATYEKAKAAGSEFPGYVVSLKPYANPEVTTPREMGLMHDQPFMFFDVDVLRSLFEQAGFVVEECQNYPLGHESRVWQYDGREYVGLVARKR